MQRFIHDLFRAAPAPALTAAIMTIMLGTTLLGGSLLGTALLAPAALAGEVGSDRNDDFSFKAPSPEEMQEAMAAWQATTSPSIYHERLDYFVGEWDVAVKMWWGGSDAPAQESAGKATYKWFFPDKWLSHEYEGSMMGMDFKGFGLWGYDNYRREYISLWVDDMGTTMSTSSGRLDQTGKVITLYSQMDEPMTGDLGKAIKYVYRIIDDNEHIFEMHDLAIGGDNTMVMEFTYTRK